METSDLLSDILRSELKDSHILVTDVVIMSLFQ